PVFATRNDPPNLCEISIVNDRFDFIVSILASNDNDSIDRAGVLKCANRVRDDWFAGKYRKQFIKAHAPAVTGRDEDGSEHDQKKKRPTPDLEFRISCSALSVRRFLHPSCFCTSALSVLPSKRPPTFACNAFITGPSCAFDVAPTSAIVSRTTFATSSALIVCGKYAFRIDNSLFSFSTSSARPPFSKLSIESWRCFTCLRMTCAASASFRRPSAPDFAITAYFNADFNMRSTPSFVVSLARIASFSSE